MHCISGFLFKFAAMKDSGSVQLGVTSMAALTFGMMVGSGIFNIPQNIAAVASAQGAALAWAVTAVAIGLLVFTFNHLALHRPDLNTGIYRYAGEGFGPFAGFLSMWGYWLCACFANVAFAVMLNDAFAAFIPPLRAHGWPTVLFGSALIWGYYLLVSGGLKAAKVLTIVLGVVKFATIALLVVLLALAFKASVFGVNFAPGNVSLTVQVEGCMMVTLWCFIGIEGASMMSARAKRKTDVGRGTMLGFLAAWGLYFLISMLSYGVMGTGQLAGLEDPSVAGLLDRVCGRWAYWLVIVSVIISLLGGWVAWTIVCAEVPLRAAETGILPKTFLRLNRHKMPAFGLMVSSVIMQLFLLLAARAEDMYIYSLSVTGMMILPCYVFSGLFLAKICRGWHRVLGIATAAACAWIIWAGGLGLFASTSAFYLAGLPFYVAARRQRRQIGEP